jgi:hypothetical protein
MKFNNFTFLIALASLGIYALWALTKMGVSGILASVAAGLIAASMADSLEYITISVIIFGLIYYYIITVYIFPKMEGFTDDDSAEKISQRLEGIEKKYVKNNEPFGITSSFSEGFEDAKVDGQSGEKEQAATASSTPAPALDKPSSTVVGAKSDKTDEPTITADMAKPSETTEKKPISKVNNITPAPTTSTVKPLEKAGFATQEGAGLFKLGEMPTEMKDGPHIDIGTTLMKALDSLQPHQITAMTADTQKLLETQKNLMSMLQSMHPILKDGKNMIDTFGSMFGAK